MKKFSFSLETARKWRERQAEIEEVRLQALFAEKRAMEDRAVSLQTELEAEHRRIEDTSFDAGELARLDDFQVWVTREKRRLGTSLSECEQRIEARRAALVEARRRFQLVDRLKEKALLEWRKTSEKEQEDLAAELYLARRTRHDG
jgi:flagellar export protein FliJ